MILRHLPAVAALLLALPAAALAQPSSAERIEKGNLILENVPATDPAVARSLNQYQSVRGAGLAGYQADGDGIFITTRFGNTAQVHHVAEPGAARQQLTFFEEPVRSVAPSPASSDLFLFTRDRGGDENYQVYVFDRTTGQSVMVSDGEGRKTSPIWSRDGSQIAWQKTLAGMTKAIVVAPLDNPAARRVVFEGEGSWSPVDFSEDGSQLIISNYRSINDSELHLLDLQDLSSTRIDPSTTPVSYGDAQFGPKGKAIFFTSDQGDEYRNLYRLDLETGEKENRTADIEGDVESVTFTRDGRFYAITVNNEGKSDLYVRRMKNDKNTFVPDFPVGTISDLEFHPRNHNLAFTLNAATSPGDVYSFKVARKKSLKRWTTSEVGGMDTASMVEPTFFRYPTFDRDNGATRTIPAFIYKPEGSGPHPVVISIHGGPESQARPGFSSTYQYWVKELGAAVVVPNVRGSAGFGKTYVQLDNGMKRKDSVKDIGALLDWIAAQDDLDEDRVVVYGGSYGGYMVLASMVDYNDRLAGGVDIVGISSFVTFLENTSDYRRDLRRAEYGDERDPEMRAFFNEIDPLNNAGDITKPLFIIQGLNDPRVPASEADQILAAMRANGVEAWYMGAKDEGHGFRKKVNRDAMTEAVAMFLKERFEE